MDLSNVAILLVGFQNDYFHADGALYGVVEQSVRESQVLPHTLELLDRIEGSGALVLNLPLLYSPDYSELRNPVGLLETIREVGAFCRGTHGSAVIDEISARADQVETLEGKTGFNAFLGTKLGERLAEAGIETVVVAGILTSICIDSTARAAVESGYRTVVLSDCSAGKSSIEHDFYCNDVFPNYADVVDSAAWLSSVSSQRAA